MASRAQNRLGSNGDAKKKMDSLESTGRIGCFVLANLVAKYKEEASHEDDEKKDFAEKTGWPGRMQNHGGKDAEIP